MSEEIEGAAEEFARGVEWTRRQVRAVAAAVAPGVVPLVEERTDDRCSVYGHLGKRFSLVLTLPRLPYEPAATTAGEVLRAAAWRTEEREGAGGRPLLTARYGEFTAGVGSAGTALRISGGTPVVWIHARWVRPPRVATAGTLPPGYRLCVMCEGWGSCRECEGLGFVDGRRCEECGLGMDCPDCGGTGLERVPEADADADTGA
ncbi:hypothetical protein ACIRSU_10485 [Streptomyces sp. NPDC101160]|uniref:hypothetical protein n=1 Tax=Streptomyces sp. NPDC101160 TaxID=3366118 RepID=UPI00380D9593